MRSKEESNSRFWLVSGVVHASILVLLFFSPVGQSIFRPKERPLRPEVIVKNEELAEVIEDIRDLAVDRLKAQVSLLEAGRERMAINFDTMNAHYQPFVANQISSARDRLMQEGQKTLDLQAEILAATQRAVAEKEKASDAMWRTYDGNRAGLVAGQEEIRRALMLTASEDAELVALQDQAETDQMAAFEALSQSVGAQNHLWQAPKRIESIEKQIAELESQAATLRKRIQENTAQLEKYRDDEPKARQALEKASAKLEQARKATGETKAKTVKAAEKELQEAKKIDKRAGERVAHTTTQDNRLKSRLKGIEKTLGEKRGQLQSIEQELPEKLALRDAKSALAAELQRKALDGQREAYRRLVALLEAKALEEAAQENAEATDAVEEPASTDAAPTGGNE